MIEKYPSPTWMPWMRSDSPSPSSRVLPSHVLARAPEPTAWSQVRPVSPPLVLNVTGRPAVPVRWLAQAFGRRWSMQPAFEGIEAPTALLSNAARCEALFGKPDAGIEEMIDRVAEWVERDGRSLEKPTHFEERHGQF